MVTVEDLADVGDVTDVQTALGDPDGDVYDPRVIEQALRSARVVVATSARDGTPAEVLREAVIAFAAYRTAITTPPVTMKEAAGVSKEMDVDSYLAELREAKDDAIDEVAGTKATFEVF